MAEAPAGGAGAGNAQAAIAKHAAVTQAGGGADAAVIARVEDAIKNSPMGWLQSMLGEVDSRASSERGQVQGKIDEHQSLVSENKKDAPKDAGPAPAPGPAAHPVVPAPAAGAHTDAGPSQHPATGGAPAPHMPVATSAPAKTAVASAPAVASGPTIAGAVASAGGDAQLDAILNAYTPKAQQSTQMLGRVKQMGDIAQGFNGQLDTYVAQGGSVEHGIAAAANFLGAGKDVSAVWATNPYRKVHGILGGIMTGLSAVRNVCGVVGNICGKLGLVLTVIGLLGMIFPPIGVAVSGIARILNVVGMICQAVSFALSGILTGLNGVVLAQQIGAGASAEEKAATADLMMSEANEASSGFINLAMVFGPKFVGGMLGSSKGVVSSLMRRAKASIGRVSIRATGNIKLLANRMVRRMGFGGAAMERVGGAWKDNGFVARTQAAFEQSRVGKAWNSAPGHLEAVQDKLMARYGNTGFARGLDRVGAWGGSTARHFDLEEKVGNLGTKTGTFLGTAGHETAFGQRMTAAAERSEMQTKQLAMTVDAKDAAHLEDVRWRKYLKQRHQSNPDEIHSKVTDNAFIKQQRARVHAEHETAFEATEAKAKTDAKVDAMRKARFERRSDAYYENKTNGLSGENARDSQMDSLHRTREKRYALEAQYKGQEHERIDLLGEKTRTAEQDARLATLNSQLKPLDEARRINKAYETDLSGIASGVERARKPEYKNWGDVGSNVWGATMPVFEMAGLKDQASAWETAEKATLAGQMKYDKGAAKGVAAARGGHGTYGDIAANARHAEMADFSAFVRSAPRAATIGSNVRGMLSGITSRSNAPAPVAAPVANAPVSSAPAPAPTAGPAPTAATPPHGETKGETMTVTPQVPLEPVTAGPATPATPASVATAAVEEAAGEALPYWPAMLPEFDHAQSDFGWMRKVAVEFKKAQIDGKQKAVDTLAVYGRYQEYAQLRAAAAAKHAAGSQATAQNTQQNVDQAGQSEAHAGQGEAKQGEAKNASTDRAAVDLPEPETRGFWGRVLGACKRWAKDKAAQVFGWIQEKIASVVLKGLCGVSMGDMREYAGALKRQQAAASGVATGASTTAAATQQSAIKLGANATKEAQSAADAIGDCDRNILDADNFMTDVTSFEQQLAEEKAYAQSFISQLHAEMHAQQAQHGGGAAATAAPAPAPAPMAAAATPVVASAAPEPTPTPAPADAEAGEISAASSYVATQTDSLTSQLETRATDYHNQLALALTNHTGKDQQGHDLKGPAKKASKEIVDEFKAVATHTKQDMSGFAHMSIDPSQAQKIADAIIQSADHLESAFTTSQHALDDLFERTYAAIRDGQRTLKSRMLDGQGVVGDLNRKGDELDNKVIDDSLPAMNVAWNQASKPIQVASNDPAPTGVAHMKSDEATKRPSAEDAATFAVENRGAGRAVDPTLAAKVGAHTGTDVSGARVHDDPVAQSSTKAMGARAFAHGNDIYVGAGESATDPSLMAHELTHVAQQRGADATPQMKVEVGAQNTAAEHQADDVAAQVVAGTSSAQHLIVDGGPLVAGQMLKSTFFEKLKPAVVAVANEQLGRLGSAAACPFIEIYFARYSALPAASTEGLLHRWIPGSTGAQTADALIPMIMERVRAGVQHWKETGKLSPDLAAAEPSLATAASAAASLVGAGSAPKAQRRSLDALEEDLGPGQAVDSKLAAPLGAEGARIHTGPVAAAKAAEHGAVAFAVGQNVVMGANAPAQGSVAGDALLAHELAHTSQQKQAAADPVARAKPIGAEDQSAERDADRAAGGAMANERMATLGNFAGAVGDVMRTGLQLQRCSTDAAKTVDSKQYFLNHETEIEATAATQIETLPFATGDAAVKWTADGNQKFAKSLAAQLKFRHDATLEDYIKPDGMMDLVENARIVNQATSKDPITGEESTGTTGQGPDRYFEAVGIAFANSIARRTSESLKREIPRYAQARLASTGEPKPSDILISHPIDPLILTALSVGGVLEIDRAAFAKEHPELAGPPKQSAPLDPSHLVLVRPNWYRLSDAAPATPEQVATALLKDPTQAFRVEVAHPLYGIKSAQGDENLLDNLGRTKDGAAFADEVALNQANALGMESKHPPAKVIAQIRMNATLVKTSIKEGAQQLGQGFGLDAFGDKLLARATKLEAGDALETKKWDAQAQAQNVIIVQAAKGIEADRQRLKTYAAQYGANLNAPNGAEKLPEEHQEALKRDADLWTEAIMSSDAASTAERMLQAAAQHSATLDIEIMEHTLAAPQAAADAPKADPDSKVNQDLHPEQLGPREVALRQQLSRMRAQVLADPSKLDASADKTAEDTRQLVFEANVIMQAEQVDQAWRVLDDASGFWAFVTAESSKLNALKTRGTNYYNQWRAVYAAIKANQKEDARKKYEALCGDRAFQTYLKEVQDAAKEAAQRAMIAKLIGMVIITIASMGIGTIVEGLVGGTAVVAGAVEGGEAVGAVTTGLGMGRTAGAVAGFIAETGTFTLASNLAMSKDHSATAMLTEFGKNIVMFGVLRGVGKAFEAAGFAKIIEAGSKEGAPMSAVVAGDAAALATHVGTGGAGVLAGIIEAKIEAAMKGQKLTDDQVHEMIQMNVAQAIIMVIVGRVLQSPLRTLKIKAAYQGSKWRMASTLASHMEALAGSYKGKPVTDAQLRDLMNKDLAQLHAEQAAFEELRAKLAEDGKSTKSVDDHLAELHNFEQSSQATALMVGLKSDAPNHFLAPTADIPAMKAQHEKLGSHWDELPTQKGLPRTYSVTNAAGEKLFITEQLPEWAMTPSGQRLREAGRLAGLDDNVVLGMNETQRAAVQALDHAVQAKDPVEIARAKAKLHNLSKAQQEALDQAFEATSAPTTIDSKTGKINDPQAEAELTRIRRLDPSGKIRTKEQLSDADIANTMNSQLDRIKPGEIDAMVDKYPPDQQERVRTVLAKSSGFGKMESLNQLREAIQPHLKDGALYTPGRGSLADNIVYLAKSRTFDGTVAGSNGIPATTKVIGPKAIVILDAVVLAQIKSDPAFAKSLRDNHAVLLEPRGFNEGNNMYNSPTPDVIAQRTKSILDRSTAIQNAEPKLPFDEAVTRALDENTKKALEGAGVGDLTVEKVDPAANADVKSSAAIAEQLNGNAGISEAKVAEALSGFNEADAALIREMLAHQAEIFSARRQSAAMTDQAAHLNTIATKDGVPPEDVYYYIFEEPKSYGMLAMAHREATGTAPDHYINGPTDLAARRLGAKTMLVVLDDVAGSGDSLRRATVSAKGVGYPGEIVISPMVSTQEANALFKGKPGQQGIEQQQTNVKFAPEQIAPALKESAWYKSLPPPTQAHLLDLLTHGGFGEGYGNALSMAFPYMAPDNNNAFFADTVAKDFIVNKNQNASKNIGQPFQKPNP